MFELKDLEKRLKELNVTEELLVFTDTNDGYPYVAEMLWDADIGRIFYQEVDSDGTVHYECAVTDEDGKSYYDGGLEVEFVAKANKYIINLPLNHINDCPKKEMDKAVSSISELRQELEDLIRGNHGK